MLAAKAGVQADQERRDRPRVADVPFDAATTPVGPGPQPPHGGWGRRARRKDCAAPCARGGPPRHPGLRLVDRLVADSPVDALLEEADKAELLVLGSRGPGAVTGFFVGSVAQRLVARSPRPVVLVRAREVFVGEGLPGPDEHHGTRRPGDQTLRDRAD
ncbi:universal stress protein, partial [Streptomyces caniscabiei]|uniref:universal stress protein n=1 Tax=Streptomyces caniscabiei TaxID=2746961 RepID=UPI00211AAABC